MVTITKTDSNGVIYELGMPAQYMQADCSDDDKQIYKHFVSVMQDLIDNPTIDRGVVIPKVLDQNGNDMFTFKVHKTVKYKYRETLVVGDIQHIFEADSPEEIAMLKSNMEGT